MKANEVDAAGAQAPRSWVWFALLRIPEMVLAVLIAVLIVFLAFSVISRYALDMGLAWSDEAARLLFVWVVFVGFSVGVRHRANIGVDLLVERLGPAGRHRIRIFQDVAILAFSALFLWLSIDAVRFSFMQRLPALQVTIAWMYMSVLVAGVLMTVYALANLVDSLRHRTRSHDALGEGAVRNAE